MITDPTTLIGLGLIVVIAVFGLALFRLRRRSRLLVPQTSETDYERVVDLGGPEADEPARDVHPALLTLQPLALDDRQRFRLAWRRSQEEFVDNPERALNRARDLLAEVMSVRGYPEAGYEQRAADLSRDHATAVQPYRAAHDIALLQERGEASTEDLRLAMVHLRRLMEELIKRSEGLEVRAS